MKKENIFKYAKRFSYLIGFPLFIAMIVITLIPMLGKEALGNHARNWILVIFAIWLAVEIIRFIINKFFVKRNEVNRKIAVVIMAVISIFAVILPAVIYGAAIKKDYLSEQSSLKNQEVVVMNFDKVTGWHRGFTTNESGVTQLSNKVFDFKKMYNVSTMETVWLDNADKTNGLGKLVGVNDKIAELIANKKVAKTKYEKNSKELALLESEIKTLQDAVAFAQTAYNEAIEGEKELKLEELNNAKMALKNYLIAKNDDLSKFKGTKVDISEYKADIIDIVVRLSKDNKVLPNGLIVKIVGKQVDLGSIISTLQGIVNLTAEKLDKLIPNEIYTGVGPEAVSSLKKSVYGSNSDLGLENLQIMQFELRWNAKLFALGAVQYASYITIGLVLLSLIAYEYFEAKENYEKSLKEAQNEK